MKNMYMFWWDLWFKLWNWEWLVRSANEFCGLYFCRVPEEEEIFPSTVRKTRRWWLRLGLTNNRSNTTNKCTYLQWICLRVTSFPASKQNANGRDMNSFIVLWKEVTQNNLLVLHVKETSCYNPKLALMYTILAVLCCVVQLSRFCLKLIPLSNLYLLHTKLSKLGNIIYTSKKLKVLLYRGYFNCH